MRKSPDRWGVLVAVAQGLVACICNVSVCLVAFCVSPGCITFSLHPIAVATVYLPSYLCKFLAIETAATISLPCQRQDWMMVAAVQPDSKTRHFDQLLFSIIAYPLSDIYRNIRLTVTSTNTASRKKPVISRAVVPYRQAEYLSVLFQGRVLISLCTISRYVFPQRSGSWREARQEAL
jgi:hypothetical protein